MHQKSKERKKSLTFPDEFSRPALDTVSAPLRTKPHRERLTQHTATETPVSTPVNTVRGCHTVQYSKYSTRGCHTTLTLFDIRAPTGSRVPLIGML